MDYSTLKHVHMSCAAASGALFALRGVWMMRASPMLAHRWVRVAPHLIDTCLLASAIGLAMWSGQYPLAQSWLSAKVVALLLYIVLGMVALKRGKTRRIRIFAFGGALLVFAYIVCVALTKHVIPFS